MNNIISNMDDVIDSRDIIERIDELTDECESSYLDYDDYTELCTLSDIAEDCKQYANEWQYGEQLIRRSYFEDYMDELMEDTYPLPKNMPFWMSIKLDYNALKQDYSSVDFDGVEYLIRSV